MGENVVYIIHINACGKYHFSIFPVSTLSYSERFKRESLKTLVQYYSKVVNIQYIEDISYYFKAKLNR